MIKRKTQLSSFDIMVLVRELNEMVSNGFINKVYQPVKDELIIRITVQKEENTKLEQKEEITEVNESSTSRYKQFNLIIKLGKYLFIESKRRSPELSGLRLESISSKKVPGSFAMLLRKHLRNAKILKIYQHEFDRIIILEVGKQNIYQIIIEMFGDGNLILVKDGKIIQPLFPHTWRARALRAGEDYKFPPSKINPLNIDKNEFIQIMKNSNKDLVRTLIMEIDIPGKFAEELCHRAGLDKNLKAELVSNDNLISLYGLLQNIFQEVKIDPKAFLVFDNETMIEPMELFPIKMEILHESFLKELDDYNSGIKQYFRPDDSLKTEMKEQKAFFEKAQRLERTSIEESRLSRQLEQQEAALDKFSVEVKKNHELGEVLYGNYQRCEEVLNEIKDLRAKVEPDEILEQLSRTDDIVKLNPHKGYVILKLRSLDDSEELEVKLSLRKNVIENANVYYEQSKHAKEKLAGANKAFNKTKQSMQDLKKKITEIKDKEVPKAKPSVGRHFWFEKYHWLLSSKGNIIVAGRDAKSNDQVVKKYLKDKDRYCHADLSGAPSVVVKADPELEEGISEDTLHEACEFALLFSKAWHSKVGSGTAYWVKPDQVSKTPQSGEYLARGAFVIRGKRNYVPNIKLELALGEIKYQDRQKLMAGPVKTVKAQMKKYVVLVPGDVKKNTMAKELSELFNVVVDDLLSVLPSGEFTLLKKVGFKQ